MPTRTALTLFVALGCLLATAAPALADTTIGEANVGSFACNQAVIVQSSNSSYAVPSGTWRLTSWSTRAGADGGQMGLIVFRPTGGGSYTVVGESPVESLTANTLNTFALGSPITVKGGDLLGMWEDEADCATSSSDTIGDSVGAGEPTVGSTFTPTLTESFVLDISATLSSAAAAAQVTSMFVCYSKWEQDGGAVFPTSEAEALLTAGWWLPTAIPGNVPGGDNLGTYHLECNPPAGVATGQSVDGGGGVVEGAPPGTYAIETAP